MYDIIEEYIYIYTHDIQNSYLYIYIVIYSFRYDTTIYK